MGNAVLHPTERHGSDEEDDEDKVGEEGSHLGEVLVVVNSVRYLYINLHRQPWDSQ